MKTFTKFFRNLFFDAHYKRVMSLTKAEAVLAEHGMSTVLYLPGIGVTDNNLWEAMEVVRLYGRLVVNQRGDVVGRFAGSALERKNSHLQLIINNEE